MENALGQPQTIVLLGGTSEIGLAIVRRLLNPTTTTVVLACRDVERGERAASGLRHRDRSCRRRRTSTPPTPTSPRRFARSLSELSATSTSRSSPFGVLGDRCDHFASTHTAAVEITRSTSPASCQPIASPTRCAAGSWLDRDAQQRRRRAGPQGQPRLRRHEGWDRRLRPGPRRRPAGDGVHMLIVRPGLRRVEHDDRV